VKLRIKKPFESKLFFLSDKSKKYEDYEDFMEFKENFKEL